MGDYAVKIRFGVCFASGAMTILVNWSKIFGIFFIFQVDLSFESQGTSKPLK